MAEAQDERKPFFTRAHAFTLVAALCFALTTFVAGVQVGRRGGAEVQPAVTAEVPSDTLLAALTRPSARTGAFDPDPLEAFMEVYEQLKTKYVEEITEQDRKRLSYGAIKGMLRELGDPYTRFMAPEDFGDFREENVGHFKGIGAMLGIDGETYRIQVIRVFRDNPAAKADLRPGDYILMINDEPTDDMSLDVAVSKIRGPAGSKVKLTVGRPDPNVEAPDKTLMEKYGVDPDEPRTEPLPFQGDPIDIEITRDDVHVPVVEYEMIGDDVAYIQLSTFNEESYTQLSAAVDELKADGAKGLVLDLRDNPGGMLDEAVKVTSLFVEADKAVVYVQERERAAETLPALAQYHREIDGWPVVVLVNRFSASASEILAGALQDHQRASVVGETTYGKGLVQTVVPLSDNSAVAITTAKYLTPNKRDINRKGIEPDVVVEWERTPEEYMALLRGEVKREEGDPQLKRALQVLREKLK